MKRRYIGPTYYGHPRLDAGGIFLDGHPMETPPGDEDLARHEPPWSKQSHPYAYDPFTIWGEPCKSKACNGSDYTDGLDEWDTSKYERLAKKHYRSGENSYERPFDAHNCKGALIEAFLRDWHDDPELKLLRVVEYCNAHSGYSTWRLDYASPKMAKAAKTKDAKTKDAKAKRR